MRHSNIQVAKVAIKSAIPELIPIIIQAEGDLSDVFLSLVIPM